MTAETIAIIACAYLVAAFVKGATGLGFSTSALPILALGLGLKSAMPLVIIPSLISNAIVMVQAGHFRETTKRFWPMFVATIPGLLLGLAVLDLIDSLVAGAILGMVLIGYGTFTLFRPGRPIPDSLGRKLAPLSGFLTGMINGMTGSQVMPVLPFLLALRLDPQRFIQTINISFSLSSIVMALGLSKLGLMTLETIWISLAGLIPVYLGTKLGGFVRQRMDAETFRKVILLMLIAFGVVLVGKSTLL
ncbi:sulfite exporter TauE/SafE family protein [Halomonas sp. HP20-15]|uniref:sulfite exporter TauE/SafE family protein n=1 Tax=Halomonas sp. HP20-15 TaxID=3085901 RepID=UPI002980AB43|nr:sulfite exporter TauE/SafE family protein [Halomonas sp. HP20-15]MDW5377902.1 sulfite exporter TauE/SafE family protein [Halomonas sp. HP20-15]